MKAIAHHVRQAVTVAVSGTDHTATFTPDGDIKGKVWYAVLVIPAYTNTVNTTLSVQDQNSVTIYTASAVAKNTTTVIVLPNSLTSATSPFPIMPGYTITLTTSGATGGTTPYTAYLSMWVEN